MNLKNLVLTSTVGMERADWLAFRNPLTHIKKFIPEEAGCNYEALKQFFLSPEWQAFNFPCIGGSEIAILMGLNPYKSIIELFYEKVGVKIVPDFDNKAMFWGRELEEQIADKWQYWDGDIETLIENFKIDKKVRKCRRLNAYVQNKAFPWIFISLDRVINKSKFVDSEKNADEGSLECKTISGYSANMWENGIPPMYVAQLQAQLGVCEFEHGEIAILKDGRDYEVYPFDKHEGIINNLIAKSKEFHYMIKRGCEEFLLANLCTDENQRDQHMATLDTFSPEPDGSTSYEKYLNKAYDDKGTEVMGTDEMLTYGRNYKFYNEQIKQIETKATECSNRLKGFMKENNFVSFGDEGHVTWKVNAKGSRVFNCKVKLDPKYRPEEKEVAEIIDEDRGVEKIM